MKTLATINPFYARRVAFSEPVADRATAYTPCYARLPQAPRTASPVPELTSLYHNVEAGNYGDRRYPGNCSGNLIKDLLRYFAPTRVFDPMSGSGTCADVCREMSIPCTSADIHRGFDACDSAGFGDHVQFPFIWAHPPYWRQKLYAEDPRDLSRMPSLDAFLERYRLFLKNCARALPPGGKLAVLMGDYTDREEGFVPLVFYTKLHGFRAGLRQHCTDIIRFGHGASSSRKVYRSAFIPGLHDVCIVFEKPATRNASPDRGIALPERDDDYIM